MDKQKQIEEMAKPLYDEDLFNLGYAKAVKDTAKEIFTQVLEWSPVGEDYHWFITTLENWLKEKYGVDVE